MCLNIAAGLVDQSGRSVDGTPSQHHRSVCIVQESFADGVLGIQKTEVMRSKDNHYLRYSHKTSGEVDHDFNNESASCLIFHQVQSIGMM